MELYFKEYGEGTPLVVLHGLLGASGNWHTLADRVFSRQHHVFTVDQRNHGRSPHDAVLDYPAMANDLIGFMDRQGLDRAHLLGHSMGGKTVMHVALNHPARVDKLIVVDIAPRAYPPAHTDLLAALRSVDLAAVGSRKDAEAALATGIPSLPVRQFLLKNLKREGDAYTWQMNLDAIEQNYPYLSDDFEVWGVFEGPALFIRGGQSDYVTDADYERIRAYFPNAAFVTIPRAGHWVHADAPEAFAAAVLDFLS